MSLRRQFVVRMGAGACLALLAGWLPLEALAQGSQPQSAASPSGAAYAEFQAFLKNTRSAKGSFRQQVVHPGGRVIESTEGLFAFSRPGRFRWEVKKPYEQLLVADGEQLFFFDRDLNQVTVRRLGEALTATPAAILFGDGASAVDFTFTEAGARDGLIWLEAVPRSREAGIERMIIGLRAGMPEALDVVDAFGRTSKFTFGALERNPAIDATLFGFRIPPGADVIRQ